MAITLNGSAGVTTNSGAVYNGIQGDTVKTLTGTSVDFTSIPSWVKRITVMFSGLSVNGTSVPIIQLGDAGGIENTGYLGGASGISAGVATSNFTTGFGITNANLAASILHGSIVLTLIDASTNTWVAFGTNSKSDTNYSNVTGGSKSLSATLDRVRITTVNGTDAFDAGSINILYE
jgi:hypothetical protein